MLFQLFFDDFKKELIDRIISLTVKKKSAKKIIVKKREKKLGKIKRFKISVS